MNRSGRCTRRWRGEGPAALILAALLLGSCGHTGSQAEARVAAEVEAVAATYVTTFNRADAEAVAALWTEDGAFVDQTSGLVTKGRARILRRMQHTFAGDPSLRTETPSLRVQPVAPDVAVAEGLVHFTSESGPLEAAAFVTLYVKRDGRWRIHRIWQTELDLHSHYEHLADLGWMIGEWTDDEQDPRGSGGRKIRNVCRWTRNRNFLTRSFEVLDATGVRSQGTEVIGWDPVAGRIRSWTFDSRGGVAECLWEQVDGRWRPGEITDHEPEALSRHQEALEDLAWMIGTWAHRDEEGSLEFSCRWAPNRTFLLGRFKASRPGLWEHEGISVIGWDPADRCLRSRMFDTDGGHAEAIWSREADQWIATARHVLPDGTVASSIQRSRPDGSDGWLWQRISREVDGEWLPGGPEIRLVRQPDVR
ncbi:MAG: SgcJ/EcaC family oxidoreductase [Planctomycetes bacterium]|nr:SgcJ/EcaC family oxidoreductase [Planctomycetota bacterium]